jgi:hypothetical protein
MTWARRRQITIISLLTLLVVGILAASTLYFLHTPASCIDGKKNQDETGIDCGGRCTTVCAADIQPATISFVRALTPSAGRTDVIAYLYNPNRNAEAKDTKLTLELFGANHTPTSIGTIKLDVPAFSTIPLFIPRAGDGTAVEAFLDFASGSPQWTKPAGANSARIQPTVRDIILTNGSLPRITATLVNPTARPIVNTTIVATVFDAQGNAIAATQTFVASLPSQGTTPLIFQWNVPFAGVPAREEVLPIPTI